jgi:hypothetical protein
MSISAPEATKEKAQEEFEAENMRARERHESRRAKEMVRLKSRISYKCT